MRARSFIPAQIPAGVLSLPSLLIDSLRHLPIHARRPAFWRVQALVVLVTVVHYALQSYSMTPWVDQVQHTIPILYVFPIIYSSLQFGREGSLRTTLWCGLLLAPSLVQGNQGALIEWLIDSVQLGTATIVALVVARLVEAQSRLTREQRTQNGLIQAVNEALVEASHRLAILHQQVVSAQEEERRRIARDLHDETVQSLILFCQGLDRVSATPRLPRAARIQVEELRTTAEQALVDVRRYCRDLRPSILDDLGLVAALEWLAAELAKRTGIEARVSVTGRHRRLSPEKELALFRIAQEALRNVEKHAQSPRVGVALRFEGDLTRLIVQDHGKGFDAPESSVAWISAGKLGITGMQERAQVVNGSLDLQTEPGRGTRITATVCSYSSSH